MTEERIKKYRYSEIFGGFGYYAEDGSFIPGTIQGEGEYTGIPSLWLRVWGCNKDCHGFGQDDPTDPSTYVLPFEEIDVSKYKSLDDLPVFSKGCDSSYSWSKKFMDLAKRESAVEIVDKLAARLHNGKFKHSVSGQDCHMVFTGGEPIMSQHVLVEILKEFEKRDSQLEYMTIETNGTIELRQDFIDYIKGSGLKELFWSVSPKIFSTSGETFETSIMPEVLKQYHDLSPRGQLKFVCNGSKQSWVEIETAIELYRKAGVEWPVWIMPVGATVEGQALVAADVADQAIFRGYNVSARVHAYLYGNSLGR
jgi:organic radical activating enzyme